MSNEIPPMELRERVRRRPGMYFGDTGPGGVTHAVNELVSNGLDLFLSGKASRIGLSIADETICYSDDGPGFPYDVPGPDGKTLAENYLTTYHDSPTADGHAPHIHLLGSGSGLMAVNAASEFFEVKTWRAGQMWIQRFEKGVATAPPVAQTCDGKTGTQFTFQMDTEVFSSRVPRPAILRRMMFDAAHLVPGVKLDLNQESFFVPGGLADLASLLFVPDPHDYNPAPNAFGLNTHREGMQVIVGLIGETKDPTIYRSWVNGSTLRQHGSHVDGLMDALSEVNLQPSIAMVACHHAKARIDRISQAKACESSRPQGRPRMRH